MKGKRAKLWEKIVGGKLNDIANCKGNKLNAIPFGKMVTLTW